MSRPKLLPAITLVAVGGAHAGEFSAGEVHSVIRLLDGLGISWVWVVLVVGAAIVYNYSRKK